MLSAVALVAVAFSLQVPVLSPGIHSQKLSRDGDRAVRYAISIPENYSSSKPVPLVLALHYSGNPAAAGLAVLNRLVGPGLADLGAIIVAPDSLAGGWNTEQNEHAVNDLLDAVIASYAIDTKKIVVTGYSMGGEGTWHFAEKYPQRFSAAVAVAGAPPASAEGWRTPILAIHSNDDEVMPIAPTRLRIEELRKAGVHAELITLNGITHYQTSGFVDALRSAVPWLKEVWKEESKR
jgi:predicted peptidase